MDTNQNTANNYQINTFIKGMNSDTSYDMIGADQYLFGLNIRITNNTLILGDLDSNNTEMVVAPVSLGKPISFKNGSDITGISHILATGSIGNVGVIVAKTDVGEWSVYKVQIDEYMSTMTSTKLYTSDVLTEKDKFSITLIRETEDVLKVYIADGLGSPICIFLENGDLNLATYYSSVDVNILRSGMYFPNKKAVLQKTSGNLKTQLVQYTYRFYKQYGYISKLAPLTNKIHVINSNRNQEQGNAEDTVTNIGFNLTIPNPSTNIFDRIQVFRISYIKYGQEPEINLIYDKKLTTTGNTQTVYDSGVEVLLKYSVDEFSAMLFQTISPQVIENNQGYLFAANIKDGTILDPAEFANNDADTDGITSYEMTIGASGYGIPNSEDDIKNDDGNNKDIKDYFLQCGINITGLDETTAKFTYNDIFVSSLLRSLREDEKYDYGIVYYDKYGRHSNVQHLQTQISTSFLPSSPFSVEYKTYIRGVKIKVKNTNNNIVGFEIVRLEKNYNNTKNLLLVALSRPVRQGKYDAPGLITNRSYRTPYYPNILLTSQFLYYWVNYNASKSDLWNLYFDHSATNVENFLLFLIFSPEINYYRNDTLSKLTGEFTKLHPLTYVYDHSGGLAKLRPLSAGSIYGNLLNDLTVGSSLEESWNNNKVHKAIRDEYSDIDVIETYGLLNTVDKKSNLSAVFKLSATIPQFQYDDYFTIKNVKDVKNPNWEEGFSALLFGEDMLVSTGIKLYKSYNTFIGGFEYNNWVSGGLYDLAVGYTDVSSQPGNSEDSVYVHKFNGLDSLESNSLSWIGPGPICLLVELEKWWNEEDFISDPNLRFQVTNSLENQYDISGTGTIICNIQHDITANTYSNLNPYFGFGNYFNFSDLPTDTNGYVNVKIFDGDVYNDYAEFVNMFKTYDFNDKKYTLLSGQVVYYIPLQSEVNVRFDYGCNYRNTNSSNLMLEPGKITGIASLDRPLHQYNRIYSDNNRSINIFYENSLYDEVTLYPNRIVYSLLKTSGEVLDNWLIFKPADFIDTDSRYGEVTNLLSRDSNIYFWQTGAFGKLSVNERSLVTDDNGETIQLGQGGVLQRTDYLSTKYGMRKLDLCAVNTEDALYWIDILNKAIVAYKQNQVINYSELLNVLNIINKNIADYAYIPTIHYDLLTNELLCRCLRLSPEEDIDLLIFNTKYNIATSVYTRRYLDIISFNNVIIGLQTTELNELFAKQYNNLQSRGTLLSPVILKFVVNSSASLTKVFDSLKVVTLGKSWEELNQSDINNLMPNYLKKEQSAFLTSYFTNKTYDFKTDIKHSSLDPMYKTDREGNIIYDIPRAEKNSTTQFDPTKGYGDRMRGKWMVETITDTNPQPDYCISHIITKFRQSYS